MMHTLMLKLLVTVWVAGQAPIVELIHKEYSNSDAGVACQKAATALRAHAIKHKDVTVSVECVPEQTRGA